MSGGTNQKIKDQNKAVEKQYDYDKDYYKFNIKQNELNYADAVAKGELKQAQLDAQNKFKNSIAKQQYEYQSKLQAFNFKNEKKAYKQGVKDFKKQKGLNQLAGQIAKQAENNKLDEALIGTKFGLQDITTELQQAINEKNFGVKTEQNKIAAAQAELQIDKDQIALDEDFAEDMADEKLAVNAFQQDQIDEEIDFITDKSEWEQAKVNNSYAQTQAKNYNDRLKAMIQMKKDLGTARASGQTGRSARRNRNSILADYGRKIGEEIDNLVFAQEDRDQSITAITTTAEFDTASKNLSKDILEEEADMINLQEAKTLDDLANKESKLDQAFSDLQTQANENIQQLKDKLGFKKTVLKQDKAELKTSLQSAKYQIQLNKQQIKLDKYGANLAAQAKVPLKPQVPPALPKPLKAPKTKLPMPLAPIKPPEPIKGALGKTSIWNDVGDGLNMALQIVPFL